MRRPLRLVRNVILISLLIAITVLLIRSWTPDGIEPRIWQLNDMVEKDPTLSSYPYHFRVLVFLNGVATISSPRAQGVEDAWYLGRIYPQVADSKSDDPQMQEARKDLFAHEMYVQSLLTAQPDVDLVVWSLDRAWYHRQGGKLPVNARVDQPHP